MTVAASAKGASSVVSTAMLTMGSAFAAFFTVAYSGQEKAQSTATMGKEPYCTVLISTPRVATPTEIYSSRCPRSRKSARPITNMTIGFM